MKFLDKDILDIQTRGWIYGAIYACGMPLALTGFLIDGFPYGYFLLTALVIVSTFIVLDKIFSDKKKPSKNIQRSGFWALWDGIVGTLYPYFLIYGWVLLDPNTLSYFVAGVFTFFNAISFAAHYPTPENELKYSKKEIANKKDFISLL